MKKYYIEKNYNCSEATLRKANDKYKLNISEKSLKLASGFGGGLGCGLTCGLLDADIMVLGMIFVKERAHENPAFKKLCGDFTSAFRKQFGGTTCKYLKKKYANPQTRCLSLAEENYRLLESFISANKATYK